MNDYESEFIKDMFEILEDIATNHAKSISEDLEPKVYDKGIGKEFGRLCIVFFDKFSKIVGFTVKIQYIAKEANTLNRPRVSIAATCYTNHANIDLHYAKDTNKLSNKLKQILDLVTEV